MPGTWPIAAFGGIQPDFIPTRMRSIIWSNWRGMPSRRFT